MSVNPSRADKTEGHLRRPGRSGSGAQHRGGGSGGGGRGGGFSAPPPNPNFSSASSASGAAQATASAPTSILSANRSFKKSGGAHSGHSRVNPAAAVSEAISAAQHAAQNGAHGQAPKPGTTASGKPVDVSTPRNASKVLPKPPTPQSAAGLTNSSASPATPKGDASRPFTLQFGTISPGVMNGVQIPARTSSAPPNLDEQKLDQAQHEPFRAIPTAPISTGPKQPQQQRKDVGAAIQSNSGESHPPSQIKKDTTVPVPPAPTVAPLKSSVHPIPARSMPIPFQHQHQHQHQHHQVPLQFAGSSPQMAPQGLTGNSLQMAMNIPVGSNPQGPQMLFPGHVLQQQALIHQGQGMSFAPPIGHQLPPQLNLGIGMASQFPQQQPRKFVGPRKTAAVKITDPVTHEEVKFDKRIDTFKDGMSSAQRTLPNMNPQPQAIPYTSHQMNYYSPMQQNYNPSQLVFSTPTLASNQMPTSSQPPRYSFPVSQMGQSLPFMTPSVLNTLPGGKPKSQTPLHDVSEVVNLEGTPASSFSAPVHATIKPTHVTSRAPELANSATTSVPSAKGELSSILKSTTDGASSNLKSGIAQDSSIHQHKSTYEPAYTPTSPNGTSKHATVLLPVNVPQKSVSEPSLSVPPTSIGDSSYTMSGNDDRKKESARKSDSFKDSQRKLDESLLAESAKVSSPTQDAIGNEASTNLDRKKTGSTADTVTSAANLSLHEVEQRTTKIMTSEAGDDKKVCASSISSEMLLESEKSQCTPAISSDSASLTNDDPFVKECVSGSASLVLRVGDDTSINLDSSSNQGGTHLDISKEQILEGTTHEKIDAINEISADTADKEFPPRSIKELVSDDIQQLDGNSGMRENPEKLVLSDYDLVKSKELEVSSEIVEWRDDSRVGEQDSTSRTPLSPSNSSNIHCPYENSAKEESSDLEGTATVHTMSSNENNDLVDSLRAPMEMSSASDSIISKVVPELDVKVVEPSSGIVEAKEKPSIETSRSKNVAGKRRKKKKELYAKADAAGASDLYNAYKGPEEKHQSSSSPENAINTLTIDETLAPIDESKKDGDVVKEGEENKGELDDWEDAADVTTPKLKIAEDLQSTRGQMKQQDEHGIVSSGQRKYSRDFLLTFAQHCVELPNGFEIASDLAEALMTLGKSYILDRDSYPSPGRITDRPAGFTRDRRVSGTMEDDKWIKSPRPFGSGHDIRLDIPHGNAVVSLRPGQGANTGVLRNPRAQPSSQFGGGILSGPVQPLMSQSGMQRTNSDADRWQRGPHRGLIPSPQTPLLVMHKAEKRYEVGKVSDEEEAKQRQLKAILNKLTPQNFEKLFAQVKEVNIDNTITLTGVISQIFDKALMEPTFCEMYANFCSHLAAELPDFSEDNEKITFKRLLLNKCQEEFERGEREQAEANEAEEEGKNKQSKEEREEKRIRARRRMLGNIRLIGELYKKKMLTERIMHECIKKLLGQHQNPDEEDIESLCKLMSTIGGIIDHAKAKEHMDAYFDAMSRLSTNQKLSSRVRFMLKDAIDLRKANWQQRRKIEGPKKIEEVHRDAAQERQAQSSRLARGPVISSGARRGAPVDYNNRGSMPMPSPSSQQSIRGFSSQARGPQDVRFEDRHNFENRTLSVPLPQRSTDDSITLGPQGGLGRGMSIRGQSLMSQPSPSDISRGVGDHKLTAGQSGRTTMPGLASNSRGVMTRSMADGLSGPVYDRSLSQDRHSYTGSRESRTSDHTFDRSSTIPAGRTNGSPDTNQSLALETKSLSEDDLREKSISAIREFYSAKDLKEVKFCIIELNASSFYPIMLSLWVTDSFERKDKEREMLADLIVNLCKPRDALVNGVQLIEGVEHVLLSLEDAVNDAPKAAEFLGRFFAKIVLEDLISLREIGRLLHEGGEETGRLTEIGLAADVLASLLECIKLEKGDSTLNDMLANSALILKDFLPPHPIRIRKLDAFLST